MAIKGAARQWDTKALTARNSDIRRSGGAGQQSAKPRNLRDFNKLPTDHSIATIQKRARFRLFLRRIPLSNGHKFVLTTRNEMRSQDALRPRRKGPRPDNPPSEASARFTSQHAVGGYLTCDSRLFFQFLRRGLQRIKATAMFEPNLHPGGPAAPAAPGELAVGRMNILWWHLLPGHG